MKARIAGWVLTVLLFLFLGLVSASGKFIEWEGKAEMLKKFDMTSQTMMTIGVVEILCAVLFVIPRTSFLGAILLTAYLGGATYVHVQLHDPFFFPPLMGVLVWVALGLRNPAIFQLALGNEVGNASSKTA